MCENCGNGDFMNPTNNDKPLPLFIMIASTAIVIMVLSPFLLHKVGSGGKKYVVGYVDPHPEEKEGAPGFLQNMPKHGYIEGKNVTYIRSENSDPGRIENAVKDMVARRVDLIFAMSPTAAMIAKKHTQGTKIPVLFITYDAVGAGLVKSLIDHESNITGIQQQGSTPKALEWLSVISPGARRIFTFVSFDTVSAGQSLAKLKQSCEQAGFRLTIAEIKTVEDLRLSLPSMPKDTDAVFMLHSWLPGSHVDEIIKETNKRRIPAVSAGHVDYEHGLVMSYAPADDAVGAQAARMAHKILQGTSAGHIPVENADVFLGINLRTAERAGLNIPKNVLSQADYIIR